MSFESESSSSTSSPTPGWTYDVFLSFRGEDTRRNFTDCLYTALVQAGIYTFRDDDELPRGKEISKHLLKAIQESRISIVVFSKGYASSRWCLDELVEILECRRVCKGQIVLPIFFDIDPSDVRKQRGSFAKAFDRHEERFKEKVKEWRKALEEAGNLSGWSLNDMANGYESKFIQKIIEDVLNKLDPKYLDVATHLVGIDPIVRNISNFLNTTTDDVRMVGIHGMAGIGKTTIAKVVFNQLCDGFEGSCFLSNVKETSGQPNGLVLLQQQLLRDILKRNIGNISDVDRGMNVIKERLRHKRILVVLDDVDHLKQLDALMQERNWYGPRSRIIITTRNECLLLKADRKYEVELLKPDESLQLFSWHAFGSKLPVEDYAKLSSDVVDYCVGLPLGLEVLGSCLSKKNKARWTCFIQKLRKIPNPDIQEKLRISFDTLDDDKLQKTFLDIACFFNGRRKDFVAKVLEARCGFNPEDDLETLIERSLITINVLGEINMHDLLRDMGREIVRKLSPDHPGKRSRIWHHEDAWNVLIKQMGTEVVEGLALDVRESKVEPLSTKSFTKMKNLQLLKMNGVHLIGCFKVLPKGLIWLCWHGCPLKSLPSDFELSNLVILDMQYSNIKELWKETTKMFNKLKILNLSYCKNLAKTPNFRQLPNLERIILKDCTSLVEVPQSIGDLKMLVFLNLEGCCRLKILSESICDAKSLETLNVSGCSQLEKLPECMGDMESLTKLLANGIENQQFLSSVGNLKCVKELSVRGCSFNSDSLSSRSWLSPISSQLSLISSCLSSRGLNWKALLPTSLAGWGLLRELKLASFGLSESATNCVDFGSLYSLEELDLSENKFVNLPSGIGCLPKLLLLNVMNCKDLLLISELPSSLMGLYAGDCTSMERVRLPTQSKRLALHVTGCQNLMEIEGMEGLGHDRLRIYGLSKNARSRLVEVLSNFECCLQIYLHNGKIPNWFSYRGGEESSLSFHLPPFFDGLAFCIAYEVVPEYAFHFAIGLCEAPQLIIKNKSNGIELFKNKAGSTFLWNLVWMGWVRRKDLAMKEYWGEELELYLKIRPEDRSGLKIKEIGVHMIVEKPYSFEESESQSEWDHDIDNLQGATSSADVEEGDEIDSRRYHHRLHYPLLGSIACSTKEQWISYLLMGSIGVLLSVIYKEVELSMQI